jgi:ribulokinase
MSGAADQCVVGVDVGTEGVRAAVFDLTGRLLAERSVPCSIRHLAPGWVEQDPDEVRAALSLATRQAVEQAPAGSVAALSVVSTAVTMLAVDTAGEPLAPAILWMDTRATAQADAINETRHPVLQYTGESVSPEWMLPKALWLKESRPQLYASADRLVELHDWLMHRLTGEWALSSATISAEWTYDAASGEWPSDLHDQVGLDDLVAKWPRRIVRPGKVVGALERSVAAELGLRAGLPVAQGMMDSYAAGIACDVFAPGRVSVSLGSSSCYLALADEPRFDARLLGPIADAFGDGRWVIQGGQTSAGSTIRWFTNELSAGRSAAELDAAAARVPVGAEGVVAVDTWQGNRTPHRDPAARGAFLGLSLHHRRPHLYRALLEAVAFGGREIVETMRETGVPCDDLVSCGGGARSPLWMQIHADALQRPITVLAGDHPAALGAAMCAAAGAALHPGLPSAAATMSTTGRTYEPDAATAEAYDAGYERYRKAYRDLAAGRG